VPQRELALALDSGRAEDTRWHARKSGERFWANGVTMRLRNSSGLLKIMRDETPAKLAEDQRILLLNELNHRIKNTLAIVQSLAEQTLRSSGVDRQVREKLTERLLVLSDAHNVLVAQNWAGADLHAIIERALAPYRAANDRFEVDGPAVRLSPQQAVSISLALNELATNAIKYGSLSVPQGRVLLTWNLAYLDEGQRSLTLAWEERGGPPVHPPGHKGFGTRMIERSFAEEDHAGVRIDYLADGLICVMETWLTESQEPTIMKVSGDPAAQPLVGELPPSTV
jgi:two-component sensor histidine kinase